MIDSVELKKRLLADREASFFRLRGGYPIPFAGATWWAILGTMGYFLHSRNLWIFLAFVTSGAIFTLALLFARLFKVDFMHDKTAATDVLLPAFTSMRPIALSAYWTYPQLVPLVLAIGMSIHWPASVGCMRARRSISRMPWSEPLLVLYCGIGGHPRASPCSLSRFQLSIF